MSDAQVALSPTTMKVEAAVRSAARRLPGDVGNALLQVVEPQALATMLGVLTLWTGSHFLGVGEIFREFRVYLKQSGYSKAYILRYLEEALCETWGQLRGSSVGKHEILAGLRFPLGTKYEITVALLGEEVKGILLGPITVGGMLYNVYQGERTEVYEQGP